MRFSEQWLRTWVNPALATEALTAELTLAGLEVDGTEKVAGDFTGVVVGEIISAEQHPNADRLQVCRVNVGDDAPLEIVCGAKNARAKIKVAVAKVGAVLSPDFKIKPVKLRGVPSSGMICSASELGLVEASEGIMELANDAPVGEDVRDYLQLDDVSIELDLTPNRGDCLSVRGVARELAAIANQTLTPLEIVTVKSDATTARAVKLDAPADCPRYVGRVLSDINLNAQTPLWMQERLRRSGLRSIAPVVDVTNYVMLELGQPMHAFDLDKLQGDLTVRRSQPGEKLTLLDNTEATLDDQTLLITDASGPLAIAGVMGGMDSAVCDNTQHILLESAFFTPEVVAGRARHYGVASESARRFERGVDPNGQHEAIERATALLLDIVGGKAGPVFQASSESYLPKSMTVTLRPARIERVLGVSVPNDEVVRLLNGQGMAVDTRAQDAWQIDVPSHRFDIRLEEDLIEEVARLYGYHRLPAQPLSCTQPARRTANIVPTLKNSLVQRGYHESISYTFVDPTLQSLLAPNETALALQNPLSAELSVMRTTIWAGLLKALQHNQHRQQPRLRLFETGLCFVEANGQLDQRPTLSGAVCGDRLPENWQGNNKVDFYAVKSDIESLLASIGISVDITFEASQHPALHPGKTARITQKGTQIGLLGELTPQVAKQLDLQGPVFLFEVDLKAITLPVVPRFASLSKFPSIRRDIALMVPESVLAAQLHDVIKGSAGALLQDVTVFDVYQGKGIPEGQKSIALGLTLQHPERTLVDDEVAKVMEQVVGALQKECGAVLRK